MVCWTFIIETKLDHNFYIEYHVKGIEEEIYLTLGRVKNLNDFEETDSHKYEAVPQ